MASGDLEIGQYRYLTHYGLGMVGDIGHNWWSDHKVFR